MDVMDRFERGAFDWLPFDWHLKGLARVGTELRPRDLRVRPINRVHANVVHARAVLDNYLQNILVNSTPVPNLT